MPGPGFSECARQASSGQGAGAGPAVGGAGADSTVPLLESGAGKDPGVENPTWARESPRAVFRIVNSRVGVLARLHQANAADIRAGRQDRGGQNDGVCRATEEGRTMKKPT